MTRVPPLFLLLLLLHRFSLLQCHLYSMETINPLRKNKMWMGAQTKLPGIDKSILQTISKWCVNCWPAARVVWLCVLEEQMTIGVASAWSSGLWALDTSHDVMASQCREDIWRMPMRIILTPVPAFAVTVVGSLSLPRTLFPFDSFPLSLSLSLSCVLSLSID